MLAFYGGQTPLQGHHERTMGLFGAISAYNYALCTKFRGGELDDENAVVIGRSDISFPQKRIIVHANTGHVEYWPSRFIISPSFDLDAVLDWFNAYVTRLETGYYQVGVLMGQYLDPALSTAILQYPRVVEPGGATRRVTRGVEVVASAVFSPQSAPLGFTFVYSIRIRLLQPHDDGYMDAGQRGFETCQLKSRHWRLMEHAGRINHVDGDGVVGMYPLLREGSHRTDSGDSSSSVAAGRDVQDGTFVYQSLTDNSATSFGGYMLFVPGSLANPTGRPFEVHLAPFPLDDCPDYLY
jgi:F-box protein 3